MSDLKNKISPKNPYWIEKERYLELVHFCRQYPIWVKARSAIYNNLIKPTETTLEYPPKQNFMEASKVEKATEQLAKYDDYISMVESSAVKSDPVLYRALLKGITENIPYDKLQTMMFVPFSRDHYYIVYRKFFWILSQKRG